MHRPHHGRSGDCLGGALGAFALSEPETRSWQDAGRACRALCHDCPRCHFVSFSMVESECGWFRHCSLDNLDDLSGEERRHARTRARARGRLANESFWRTAQVRPLPFADEYARQPGTGIKLRTFSVVRWPGGTFELPLWVVDDWAFSWIVSENHGEALVMTAVRRTASACVGGNQWMLDIGANVGTYALIAGALGCRVLAFEPQPNCHARMRAALERNVDFQHLVRIVPRPVGRNAGATLWTPAHGCHSDAPSLPSDRVRIDRLTAVTTTSVQNELKDDIGGEAARIAIVKIDTEGAEINVLASLRSLWPRIDNLVVETTPWRWPAVSNATAEEAADLYASLFDAPAGFRGAFTNDGTRIGDAAAMHAYILHMNRGFHGIRDLWIARDPSVFP